MKKRIVIVGAGYSGTLTAKKLAKKLNHQDVEITLIDKNPFHTMLTELHEVAAGRIEENGIRLDLKKIFEVRNVNVVLDTVTDIDFQNKKVIGQNKNYDYDYIVLSAGSRPNYYGIPGAQEFAYSLWSYEGAIKLKERILNVFQQAQCITDPDIRKQILAFWVIGAGFSGVEMISELAEYVPILCEKYGIPREEITLYLVDGLSRVIPNLTENLSAKAEKKLKKLGITVLLNTKVDSIGKDHICLKAEIEVCHYMAGTIIWTAGTQSETIVQAAGEKLGAVRGRIQVDSYLRSSSDESVFVVGDNMFFIPKGEQNPVPQMVENCEQSAHVVSHNIITSIRKKGSMHEYKPNFHGVMVSIGSHDGVARINLLKHSFCLSGFLAIAAKHAINIVYFMQVLGWYKVIRYIRDEFFRVRNNRSLVGGHFSNRTPGFLIVPLRIWFGLAWLWAGLYGSESIFVSLHNPVVKILEIVIGVSMICGLFTTVS
ncbi:MAG: NAD(P)/FAD-dependent oxidoreductase, partial [Clostridiales bacterium]|nr:NAD(P)/FAD-dependent oxidoreductase [Clostridiales bacterium]